MTFLEDCLRSSARSTRPKNDGQVGELRVGVDTNVLYAVGGYDQFNNILNTVEAYDRTTNTWTTKADMPSAH